MLWRVKFESWLPPVPLPIDGGLVLTCLRPHRRGWPWRCRLKGGVPLSTSWGTGAEAGSAEERGSPWLGSGTEAVKVLGREKTWVRPSPQPLNPLPTSRPLLLQGHLPFSQVPIASHSGSRGSRQSSFPCPSSGLPQLPPLSPCPPVLVTLIVTF